MGSRAHMDAVVETKIEANANKAPPIKRHHFLAPMKACEQKYSIKFAHYKPKNKWKFVKFSYLLTPRSTVLLEKLTVPQLVNKFPAFYGTRRFITAFTSARHLSLS